MVAYRIARTVADATGLLWYPSNEYLAKGLREQNPLYCQYRLWQPNPCLKKYLNTILRSIV